MSGRIWLAVAASAALSRAAAAEPTADAARVSFEACGDLATDDVRSVLAVELRALPSGPQERPEVVVTCDGDRARIVVQGAESREREVRLAGVPARARGRLVALAIAEAVSALAPEVVEVSPRPISKAAPAPARPRARVVTARSAPPANAWRAAISGGFGVAGRPATLSVGASMGLERDLGRLLAAGLDLSIDRLEESASAGEVDVLAGALGVALLARTEVDSAVLAAGALLRGGVAHLRGRPDPASGARGHGFAAPWGGVGARAQALLPAVAGGFAAFSVEAGLVTLPVSGEWNGRRVAAIAGPWVTFRIGIGFPSG